MTRTTRFCRVVAVALGLSSVPGLAAASQAEVKQDTISILSVKPEGPVPAGVRVKFSFELEITLQSVPEASLAVGFNSGEAQRSEMGDPSTVKAGTQRLRVYAETVPVDRGRVTAFGALIILGPRVTGLSTRFKPLATAFYPISVAVDATAPRPAGAAEFRTAAAGTRRRMLDQIAIGRSELGVEDVIEIIRDAVRDPDAVVRLAAMKAVGGRALASIFARYLPRKDTVPTPLTIPERPPAAWITDDERLGYMLWDTLLPVATTDRDEQVRVEALKAMSVFGRLDSVAPYTDQFVDLAANAFRTDPSGAVRAEVVRLFDNGPNDTPLIRAVLRDAHLDIAAYVREAALTTLHPRVIEGPRLSYADVGATLVTLLRHPDAAMRLSAIRALEALRAGAHEALPALDRLSASDRDGDVRRMARRAADVIRTAP